MIHVFSSELTDGGLAELVALLITSTKLINTRPG